MHELKYTSGEPLLFRIDVVNNFAAKEGMVKDNSIREHMFCQYRFVAVQRSFAEAMVP